MHEPKDRNEIFTKKKKLNRFNTLLFMFLENFSPQFWLKRSPGTTERPVTGGHLAVRLEKRAVGLGGGQGQPALC